MDFPVPTLPGSSNRPANKTRLVYSTAVHILSQAEKERLGGSADKVVVPIVRQLQINYRTHNGILAAAALTVELIQTFFPLTVDKLPPEVGFYQGPKPKVFPPPPANCYLPPETLHTLLPTLL